MVARRKKQEARAREDHTTILCCIVERLLGSVQQMFDGRRHRERAHERDHLLELVKGL